MVDFGDKYKRDWDVFRLEAPVKLTLRDDERLLEPHHKTWAEAGGKTSAINKQLSSTA